LLDYNSGLSLQYEYLYGNRIDYLLGRADPNGNPMWYLTDKLGSVRENVTDSGVVDSITYDTYGNIIAETHPTSGDRFKYTSREWDSEIGQYFYRARYYSPTDGRFDSEDPSGFKAGDSDLYRYVRNIPTSAIDPTGLRANGLIGFAFDELRWIYAEGYVYAYLLVWADTSFDIWVIDDTWNRQDCSKDAVNHINAIYGDNPWQRWAWSSKRGVVTADSVNGEYWTKEHKTRYGQTVNCPLVVWSFSGSVPQNPFTDELYLQLEIAKKDEWNATDEKLTVGYSIELLPYKPPFTKAEAQIKLSGTGGHGGTWGKPPPLPSKPGPVRWPMGGGGNGSW
jgi:RHS repeat-associated protein